ncbi:MAG: hypothetical protein Q9190_004243 [Brigantiaea leucoxantha]
MAHRVAFSDTEGAIRYIEEDGGVILTGFATENEVATVNADAAPYISAVAAETEPILSASATMEISPGEKAQDLHRDDFIWQQQHNADRNEYQLGSDVGMGIIVSGTKTFYENGATAVSPERSLRAARRRHERDYEKPDGTWFLLLPFLDTTRGE